jgi:flavin reductase (DIM6/NTAB) family NADH-FMN oxidoreductase RutF
MGDYKRVPVDTIAMNPFHAIGKQWMLITAGTLQNHNTMTASWGGMGFLWNKSVCFVFVRPQRYTFQFMEETNSFTLSFFPEKYRKALTICGTESGRDVNKIARAGLTPSDEESGFVSFKEANQIFCCRKLYIHDIDPAHFLDESLFEVYPDHDYHRMYIGEIAACLER